MEPHSVQQFFADYFKTLIIKGSYVNSVNPCYSNTLFPRFANSRIWQPQTLDQWMNNNIQQSGIAFINGIIVENNYLKHCLQKAQTTTLCDVLDVKPDGMQKLNDTVSSGCPTSKASSFGDGEIGHIEDEIPKNFLHDFLHLMDATKHLPIRTQNIVALHFASEHREQMNQQNTSKSRTWD